MKSAATAEIDPHEVVRLTRSLVDIPSVTGDEATVMEYLESRLQASGWTCRRQSVEESRFNLWCCDEAHARVIFSTHLDTVPPHFASREDERYVYGRGSCDAKGIAAAMICAAESLKAEGLKAIALLLLVGEETDSAGARAASRAGVSGDFLINGEPTANQLVTAHKGVVMGRITAQGVPAHSAYPERGVSAVHRLVELLSDLKGLHWPTDEELGESHLNIGLISGGEAPNVIAGRAQATFLIRTVKAVTEYVQLLERTIGNRASLEILKTTEPQQMLAVEGFARRVANFSTDIPALRSIARPLLIGPGDIFEAHTNDEKISKQDLQEGISTYRELAHKLLDIDPNRFRKEKRC